LDFSGGTYRGAGCSLPEIGNEIVKYRLTKYSQHNTVMANSKDLPAWKSLEKHGKKLENVHMRDLFTEDPGRFRTFLMALEDLFFDYSKNLMTEQTLSLPVDLA
jgi:hypothetical protein